MIDSLIGISMLVMLTGWMAGLVSVQYSLQSSRRSLGPAEQIEFLRAFALSRACDKNMIATAKQDAIELLQELLIAPDLMRRPEGVSLVNKKNSMLQNGDIPYSSESQANQLLRLVPIADIGTFQFDKSAKDWTIWMRSNERPTSDAPVNVRLFICQ